MCAGFRIDTLPTDVILHILEYAHSWQDIASFEKTSRRISEVFEQRDIWSTLVMTCIEPPLGMAKLCMTERPIYTYSINELRDMFKQWKNAENVWTTANDPDKRRIRDLKLYYSAVSYTSILAPGGRWLIAITYDAAAFYYDLDAPSATHGLPLFPSQTESTLDAAIHSKQCHIVCSRSDRILGTETLSFRFALWIASTDQHRSSMIQVWETALIFDEDLGESRLAARKVASVPLDASFRDISIESLVENHIILNVEALANDPNDTGLVLFDWIDAHRHPSTFERRVLIVPTFVNGCSLVEYNLLVSSLLNLKKYDYRRFRVATSWDPAQYNRNIKSLALFHGTYYCISGSIPIQTNAGMLKTVAALGEKQIISVKLDSDYRYAPSWSGEAIGSFPPMLFIDCSRWAGYRHAFAIDESLRLVIGRFRSRTVGPTPANTTAKGGTTDVLYLDIPLECYSKILHYDESIGRLILGNGTARVRIIDFAT